MNKNKIIKKKYYKRTYIFFSAWIGGLEDGVLVKIEML